MQRLLTALLALCLMAGAASADSLVRNITTTGTQPIPSTTFFYGDQNGTDVKFAGNIFATLGDTQTLTNKTVNCANNVCTVRIGTDVSGLGTGVATALGTAQGNGTKVQLSTGSATAGKCVEFDANGNTVPAVSNAACGAGGSSGVGVQGGQSPLGMGDNATALASGHYYYFTNAAFTAARSKNLPDSATQGVGDLEVIDAQQTLTQTNTLSLCAAGTDTLNGTTNGCVKLSNAGAGVALHNDGAGKYTTTWVGNLPSGTAAGQLLIWDNTAKTFKPATLTQGSNVTITNNDGAITIAASAGGSGALTLISSITTPSTTGCGAIKCFAWTGLTLDVYELKCHGVIPSSSGADLKIQLGTGSTSWGAGGTDYAYDIVQNVTNAVTGIDGTANGAPTAFQQLTSGAIGVGVDATIFDATSSSLNKLVEFYSLYITTGPVRNQRHGWVYYTGSVSPVTAIRFIDGQGSPADITSGTCSLYSRAS